MKFLFDFFPLLAFFIAFYVPEDREQGIYLATYVLIIATVIQISCYWLIYKKFERMHIVTFIVVFILGSLTVYFNNTNFIKFKPTVVNWCFAAAFIASHFFGKKTLFQHILNAADSRLQLPTKIWRNLNISWAIFFIFMGVLNLYIAFNFSIEFWVNFKTWGVSLVNVIFLMATGCYLYQYLKLENPKVKNNS